MRSKIYYFIVVFLMLFTFSCSATNVEDVKSMLAKDLPIGTTKNEVVNYLNSKGISHSADYKPELYYDKSKEFTASIPNTSSSGLVKGGIYMKFKFDEKDKLTKFTVEEVFTGP